MGGPCPRLAYSRPGLVPNRLSQFRSSPDALEKHEGAVYALRRMGSETALPRSRPRRPRSATASAPRHPTAPRRSASVASSLPPHESATARPGTPSSGQRPPSAHVCQTMSVPPATRGASVRSQPEREPVRRRPAPAHAVAGVAADRDRGVAAGGPAWAPRPLRADRRGGERGRRAPAGVARRGPCQPQADRRARELESVAGVDARLAIQREVVLLAIDDRLGEQPGPRCRARSAARAAPR